MSEAFDAATQVERFKEFFEVEEKQNLLDTTITGKGALIVDFGKVAAFDPKLALELLDFPEESFKAAENAIQQIDVPTEANLKLRVFNLPPNHRLKISELRVEHLKKFLSVEGIIRQKSPVKPKTTLVTFECPICGNNFTIIQEDEIIKQPYSCSCGRKGNFRQLDKQQVDFQGLKLEEPLEEVTSGDKGERITILVEADLTKPSEQPKYVPGNKVVVNGIYIEVVKWKKRAGKEGQSTTSETVIIANSIEQSEALFENIKIDKETELKILETSKNPKLFELMRDAVAPTIYGYPEIKMSIVLQLFGGNKTGLKDDVNRRGEINILLVGDPGLGKSILVKRATMLHPKSRLAVATTATGIGFTAAVVKDEFLGGWTAEGGAMVLANHGLFGLDEIGNAKEEDLAKLQEGMEQGCIHLDKANVHETLPAETSVLAAGNPKLGRFDVFGDIADQIGLKPQLISRFDLVFPIQDSKTTEADDLAVASTIFSVHKNKLPTNVDVSVNPFLELSFFRAYIAYTKRLSPVSSDEVSEFLSQHYVKLRNMCRQNAKMKGVQPRELEGMIRLSEASAKVRLSKTVIVEDAKRAVNLKDFCWKQIGFDPATGGVDMDKIYTGITGSRREKMQAVKDIVSAQKIVPVEDAKKEAAKRSISSDEFDDIVDKLKRNGDLYEPRYGFLSRLS